MWFVGVAIVARTTSGAYVLGMLKGSTAPRYRIVIFRSLPAGHARWRWPYVGTP
jgi:hypothetical protein